MSIYGRLDTGVETQLASNQGWGDFGRWADELDVADYGQIVHLREHGWCQQLSDLQGQLRDAAREAAPDPDTAHVVKGLVALLGQSDGASVLTVSNGLGAGDDDGGE